VSQPEKGWETLVYSVSCLITSLIILSFGLCDRIDQVIKNSVKVILPYNRFGYCYHSVHIVRLARFQSDHIKRLPLHKVWVHLTNCITFFFFFFSHVCHLFNLSKLWKIVGLSIEKGSFSVGFYNKRKKERIQHIIVKPLPSSWQL
jgi:hypothetical protein